MSSLSINDLYETINEKNMKRIKHFDDVLKKIHNRIKYNARLEKTFCFYQVPEMILGVPLYNILDLREYISNSLKKDGFKYMYIDPNWFFISWEVKSNKKKSVIQKQKPKNQQNYKLIDEYKPSGNLIYNQNDLLSMKDKMSNIS